MPLLWIDYLLRQLQVIILLFKISLRSGLCIYWTFSKAILDCRTPLTWLPCSNSKCEYESSERSFPLYQSSGGLGWVRMHSSPNTINGSGCAKITENKNGRLTAYPTSPYYLLCKFTSHSLAIRNNRIQDYS